MSNTEAGLGPVDQEIYRHLNFTLGHHHEEVNKEYLYRALAISVRDRLIAQWNDTQEKMEGTERKRVYYLSLEFLIGRSLTNAILNLDLEDSVRDALQSYGTTLEEAAEQEHDAGLGNGGLGEAA